MRWGCTPGARTAAAPAGASGVEALVQANHRQEQAKATAMQRRKERDAAFKALIQWLRCAQRAAEFVRAEAQGSLGIMN